MYNVINGLQTYQMMLGTDDSLTMKLYCCHSRRVLTPEWCNKQFQMELCCTKFDFWIELHAYQSF